MLGDPEILVETAFRTFLVRVVPFGDETPTAAQVDAARVLADEFRFGLSHAEPRLVDAAQRLHHALLEPAPFFPRPLDASLSSGRFLDTLADFLEEQLERGRLVVEPEPSIANVPEIELTVKKPKLDAQPSGSPLSPQTTPLETAFEVAFVDEIGQPISGLKVTIQAGDVIAQLTTNAAGIALLDGTTAPSATVTVVDIAALEKIMEPRWSRKRTGTKPTGSNTSEQPFDGGDLDTTSIKSGVPNTVVITPVLAKIQMLLFDKTGKVPHAGRDYSIAGPVALSGTTDENGGLVHTDLPPGNYVLTLTVEDGDPLQSSVVARIADEQAPQLRFLGALPRVTLARLKGLFFETNKSFLLPATMSVFDRFRQVFLDNNPAELLIVGHTDTTGEPSINDPLSVERAENTAAFVLDDVDTWLKMYDDSVSSARRWSSNEDQLMMSALPDFDAKPEQEDPLHWFQRTRGLDVDGAAGPKTRRQLIGEYMALDDASLKDPEFDIHITTHGCGDNFPLDDSGEELDTAPADNKDDQTDRRVEFFFFDREFGIQPPPPGAVSPKGSTAYPTWRQKAELAHEVDADSAALEVLIQDPNGQALPNTEVQLLQDGVVVRTRTSDDSGMISFTGHDPSRPCELVISNQSPLVIDGGRDEDPDLAIADEDHSTVDALDDGCQVELADNTPFVPPELEGESVLV